MEIPQLNQSLNDEQVRFLHAFSKACRRSILEMVKNSQSGHPGGSLSSIDYLSLLYAFVIGQTGEPVIVSNGHISPGVYSVLAEMGYIDKEAAVRDFRKIGTIYEGHITRHVRGVWYGTGPLGVGTSVASGMALAEQLKAKGKGSEPQRIFLLLGDGEAQEGQVYEMMNFSKKYQLNNLIAFVDYNKVQLTASLEDIMPLDLEKMFEAAGWEVIDVDAHDFEAMWTALGQACAVTGKPVVLMGHSVMGKGVELMEPEGEANRATWHGKAPKPDDAEAELAKIEVTDEELERIEAFRRLIEWRPEETEFVKGLTPMIGGAEVGGVMNPVAAVDPGEPILYEPGEHYDCRGAYGKALLDLVKRNPHVVAATADLGGSVKTQAVNDHDPDRHIECGIAEQHMVSMGGGMSLRGFVPFVSTFGAFMTSRAKDQARVNDINQANVKMVATHCGLSVGEDGPTHQAIDDMGSMLGLLNTRVIEPADANQCDRIIRYVASHYGNFYVRMGRHKFEVLTKEDGTPFYGTDYEYVYGRCDVIRPGSDLTIAASGASITEAVKARELLSKTHPNVSIEIVAVSSIKQFDDSLLDSIRKTGRVITVEDHNPYSGLGGQLARVLADQGIAVDAFQTIGVTEYQLSGKWNELYAAAGIDAEAIARKVQEMI